MASSEARRQKQLAKKKAKRTEKRTYLARQNSDNPVIQLAAAADWPIVAAWVPENLWEQGIGQLILARRRPDGRLGCAAFLVDVYCLGVKNAFWHIMTEAEYQSLLTKADRVGHLQQVSPPFLAKLVQDSVQYAQDLGIAPHPDYAHARRLLAGIDASQCPDTFEFGMNGKPFYVRGPHESLEKAEVIAHRIKIAGGDYTIPLKPNETGERSAIASKLGGEVIETDGPQ